MTIAVPVGTVTTYTFTPDGTRLLHAVRLVAQPGREVFYQATSFDAVTGKDCPVRVALVLVAALSAASLLTVVADTRPLGTQFWPVGEAVVNIAVALALLNSPLRPPVKLHDHELDQGE